LENGKCSNVYCSLRKCDGYSSELYCNSCDFNCTFVNGKCQSKHCDWLDEKGNCLKCINGYYLESGVCKELINFYPTGTSTCKKGYYYNKETGNCTICKGLCTECYDDIMLMIKEYVQDVKMKIV